METKIIKLLEKQLGVTIEEIGLEPVVIALHNSLRHGNHINATQEELNRLFDCLEQLITISKTV